MTTIAYRARFIFSIDGPPLEDGCVLVEGQRIAAVGRQLPAAETHDFGDAAILPGLVNAHTHLEFSDVAAPLGEPGMAFPDWIRQVIQFRRVSARAADAVEQGVRQSVQAGTTTLGEIAQPGWRPECFQQAPLESLVFLELLGLSLQRAEAKSAEGLEHLQRTGVSVGLSPHAPYTVSADLFGRAIELARAHSASLAFHLAESREEIDFLQTSAGPFRTLLEDLGVWVDGAIPRGVGPSWYLEQLAAAPQTLIIHGNYLSAEEMDQIATYCDRMSVVYCPRTHAYFGHAEHPWRQLLARGVTVAIGTDSRASTPDLSVLEELRLLSRLEGTVPPADLLRLGTLNGAQALGWQREIGSLSPGKLANLTIVPLPAREVADPYERLFDSQLQPLATVWRGKLYQATASCSSAFRTPT